MAKPAQTSFSSILDTPATEVERPKPLPAGTYSVIVQGMPEHGESSQKKTPFVKFTYAIQAAGEDVDEEELNELLTKPDGSKDSLTSKTMKDTYYTTPDALWRLTDTLENMGIDAEGKTVRQMLDETPNSSLDIVVGHRASDDGQQIFAEVKRTLKAE
jgi:hypothetical protein